MPQKILAGRCSDPQLRGDLVAVKVDQVVLSRAPAQALAAALALGLKKTSVEVAVAYDGTAVTNPASLKQTDSRGPYCTPPELPQYGVQIARAGIGFPAPVHLERFAAPARLALTDDPRLCTVGGVGMLALLASPAMLGQALATGMVWLRPARSVQIHLSGRLRPFVCARDVALELLRRGLDEIVQRIEKEHAAPVVLEFAGPSARLLSVPERSVLTGIAPQVGAAAAMFISDEKTEVYLRDQRRSKAHRAISPDPGAPCEEVLSIDLAAVDPMLMDEDGQVRPVRDLAGKPVGQVILGGDSGASLRDMLAAAALLKSKRVPSRLDLLVSPPSRQVLEVLAQQGALVDLVATGARVIEPDARVVSGELYPPPLNSLSMRTADPEPRAPGTRGFVVASAETLAYAVATGAVGDPRSFKRPVRVTVPRALPTDDVLVTRDKKGDAWATKKTTPQPALVPQKDALSLEVLESLTSEPRKAEKDGFALVLGGELDARMLAEQVQLREGLRAVIGLRIPAQTVTLLAAEGISSFSADDAALKALRGTKNISLPPAAKWGEGVALMIGKARVALKPLSKANETTWISAGGLRVPPAGKKGAASPG